MRTVQQPLPVWTGYDGAPEKESAGLQRDSGRKAAVRRGRLRRDPQESCLPGRLNAKKKNTQQIGWSAVCNASSGGLPMIEYCNSLRQ